MKRMFGIAVLALLIQCRSQTQWYPFLPPDRSFKVDFPDGPPITRNLDGDSNRTDYDRFTTRGSFVVEVFEGRQYSSDRAPELLRDYPNPASGGITGSVTQSSALRMGPYPGREVRIEGKSGTSSQPVVTYNRAYITNGRGYLVTAAGTPEKLDAADVHRFLESFAILK